MTTEITALFESHRNTDNAAAMTAYLKNQFSFLGIKKPERQQLCKAVLAGCKKNNAIDWQWVNDLWQRPEREYQYLAMEILLVSKTKLTFADLDKIEHLITQKSWWDTVDTIAGNLLGEMGKRYPEQMNEAMLLWSRSDNMWKARSAILFQLKYKNLTNTAVLSECILYNNSSTEFFIRKAIGWALREYSKTNPDWVRDFIKEHPLSALSVREGSKYL